LRVAFTPAHEGIKAGPAKITRKFVKAFLQDIETGFGRDFFLRGPRVFDEFVETVDLGINLLELGLDRIAFGVRNKGLDGLGQQRESREMGAN